jgi:hypothetical protein
LAVTPVGTGVANPTPISFAFTLESAPGKTNSTNNKVVTTFIIIALS